MPEIFVDDVLRPMPRRAPTWGDLLVALDEEAAGKGVLLTSARFDGVEEPSFRDPEVTARRLTSVRRVDVETATPAAFLRQCLLESMRPLEGAADLASHLGGVYRGHDVSRGHEGLTALARELRDLTALVAMLTGPLQIDLSAVTHDGVTAAQQMDQLGSAIDALVSAQAGEDWLTVADVLEYDLEPAIRRWTAILSLVANRL